MTIQQQENGSRKRGFYTSFNTPEQHFSSVIAFGTFRELVSKFTKLHFNLISLEENAWLRIQKGKFAPESWTGNFVREAFLYIPYDAVYLIKDSHTQDTEIENATTLNMLGYECTVDFEHAKQIAKRGVKIPYSLNKVSSNKLHLNPVTKFAFGSAAKPYGKFLLEAGISALPIWTLPKGLVDAQPQAFVRQGILRCMDNWSGLVGSNADLHLPYGARFISATYKGKIDDRDEIYSTSQIISALKKASLSGLEIPILRALRQSGSLPVNYTEDPFSWGSGHKD